MRPCAVAAVFVFLVHVPIAESGMLAHFDLAGLELQSDAVVDKTTVTLPLGHLDADAHGAMRLAP
jgi:hypothetical protein